MTERGSRRGGAPAAVLAAAAAAAVWGCGRAPADEPPSAAGALAEDAAAPRKATEAGDVADVVLEDPPPFGEGLFPCSSCHDPEIPFNPKRRKLKLAHQEVAAGHAGERGWCFDCHDRADRDQLHLAGGETVPFEESHQMCGQCHGEVLRDWQAGVHGRRTGFWDGAKRALRCAHCHDAHSPRFGPITPDPPPPRPRRTR